MATTRQVIPAHRTGTSRPGKWTAKVSANWPMNKGHLGAFRLGRFEAQSWPKLRIVDAQTSSCPVPSGGNAGSRGLFMPAERGEER